MSRLPERQEWKATSRPSGEGLGVKSVAASVTSRLATPPAAGTVQMSPPETTASSAPSGEIAGSAKDGSADTDGRAYSAARCPLMGGAAAIANASTPPAMTHLRLRAMGPPSAHILEHHARERWGRG